MDDIIYLNGKKYQCTYVADSLDAIRNIRPGHACIRRETFLNQKPEYTQNGKHYYRIVPRADGIKTIRFRTPITNYTIVNKAGVVKKCPCEIMSGNPGLFPYYICISRTDITMISYDVEFLYIGHRDLFTSKEPCNTEECRADSER